MKKIEFFMGSIVLFSLMFALPGSLLAALNESRVAPLARDVMSKVFPRAKLAWEKTIEAEVHDVTPVGDSLDMVVSVERGDRWFVEYWHHQRGVLWSREGGGQITAFDQGRKVCVVSGIGEDNYETVVLQSTDGRVLWRKEGTDWFIPSSSGRYFFGREVVGSTAITVRDSSGQVAWEGTNFGFPKKVHAQMAFLPGDRLVAVFCSEGKAEISLVDLPKKTILWRKRIPTSWQVWCDLLYLSTSASGDRIVFDLSVNGPNYGRGEHPIVCFSNDGELLWIRKDFAPQGDKPVIGEEPVSSPDGKYVWLRLEGDPQTFEVLEGQTGKTLTRGRLSVELAVSPSFDSVNGVWLLSGTTWVPAGRDVPVSVSWILDVDGNVKEQLQVFGIVEAIRDPTGAGRGVLACLERDGVTTVSTFHLGGE